MKQSIFLLGCIAIALASCHSPEERATMKASADSAAHANGTAEKSEPAATVAPAADAPKTDTVAKEVAPKTDAPVVAATEVKPAEKPAALPGEALLKKSDCLACHNVSQKIVGPAYKNVAAKYAATDENINMLVDKVINGGSGVWGAVPMSPHPALSKTDAKEMVKYILSLKK